MLTSCLALSLAPTTLPITCCKGNFSFAPQMFLLSPHLSRCSGQPLLSSLLSGLERLPCTAGQAACGTIQGTAGVYKHPASGLH